MSDEFILLWSIRISLLCYAGNLALLLTHQHVSMRRWINLAGFLLIVIHVVAAYQSHDWSHANAVEQTAADTEQTIGISFGAGIYFNHLFVILWLVDVIGDWSRFKLSSRYRIALHGYLVLIAVNGTIVFETGPTRWIGIVVVLLLCGVGLRCWGRAPPDSAQHGT